MNHLKQLAGQTVIYGLSINIYRLLNYLVVPLHTNLIIDTAKYGVITNLYGYAAILLALLTYGMETGYFRFSSKYKNREDVYSSIIVSLFFTSGLFIFLMYLYSGQIANFIQYPQNPEYIRWFGIIIGLDAFTSIPMAKLRKLGRPLKFAFVNLISIIVYIIINVFFLWLVPAIIESNPDSFLKEYYDPEELVKYVFIANIFQSIVKTLLLSKEIFDVKLVFNWKLFREILRYSWPILFVSFFGLLSQNIEKVIMPFLIPNREVAAEMLGIYGACFKLGAFIVLFNQMFRYAADPFFFSKENETNAKDIYADVMKYFVLFSVVIFLVVSVYLDIFKFIIGSDYWAGLEIVPIILLANVFQGILYNLSFWYKLTDKTKYGLLISFIGALIVIVLNIILVPKIGYVGSAIGYFSSFFIMSIISYFIGRKHYKINYETGKILLFIGGAILIFGITRFINLQHLVFNYIIKSLLLLFYIFAIYKTEYKNLKNIIRTGK